MIFFSKFGYALRHQLSYNPKSKPGILMIWSSHNDTILVADPLKNGDDAFLEIISARTSRSAIYLHISIGSNDDVFAVLTATLTIKKGRDYSFKNHAGRLITFSRSEMGNNKLGVCFVNVRHIDQTGIFTLKEINELEIVTKNLLQSLGFSNQKIEEKVNTLIDQSVVQRDNADLKKM